MNSSVDIEMNASGNDRSVVVNHLHLDVAESHSTIISNVAENCLSLFDLASTNPNLRTFLIITGNYWPSPGVSFFARANYIVSKIAVLGCAALLGVMAILIAIINNVSITWSYVGIFFALFFVLFLATVSVLPAQYVNDCRLKTVVQNEDFAVADGCVPLAMIYGITSFVFIAAAIGMESQSGSFIFLAAAIASTFVVLSLMFNLFFLLLDLKVSLLLLDQLHLLADTRLLTMEKFSSVRAEIQRRVTASRLACDFILLPSLASIIGIAISVLLLDRTTQHSSDDDEGSIIEIEHYVGLIFIQLKELFYVAVAFWYVAKVNGRADELTLKLSETVWGDYQSINNILDRPDHVEKGREQRMKQVVNDMQRVSVYMSANSRPISFTLLFKRVTWKTVVLSVIGFVVTLLVGIIKSIATQAAT